MTATEERDPHAEGFVLLFRKACRWELYNDPLCLGFFVQLILRASWRDTSVNYRGILIKLNRGELITTVSDLAKASDLSISQVRTLLKKISKVGSISTGQIANRFTMIKIVNYGKYQDSCVSEISTSQTESQTDDRPIADQSQTDDRQNNKETKKQGNKETKIPPVVPQGTSDGNGKPPKKKKPPTTYTYSEDDMHIAKKIRDILIDPNGGVCPKMKHPNLRQWASEMRKLREIDKRSIEDIRKVFLWANADYDFWRKNILSPNSLRKHFDLISAKMETEKNKPSGEFT